MIHQDIIYKYNLMDKKIDDFFYARAEKGLYDLVQDDIIAHMALEEPHWYINLHP